MKHINHFLLCFCLFASLSCWATNDSIYNAKVYILQDQDTERFYISDNIDTVKLLKKPFIIGVELETNLSSEIYYFASASTNDLQFNKAKIGLKSSDVEYFGPGRSGAMYPDRACDFLMVNNNGCCDGFHYMRYTSPSDRTLNAISVENNKYELQWPIAELLYAESMRTVEESIPNELYITIFIDKNLNNIIDETEIYNTIILLK